MVGKITGISRDLIIHPGETIADILADRNISQAELAAQTGVSAAYISSIISGKKGISPKFAMALEYALNVPKSFWLNLQANYEAELLDLNETETVTEEEQKIFNELKEVAKYLKINVKQSIEQKILDLRKALRVSSLTNLQRILPSGAFRTSTKVTVNPTVVGAWLRICQLEGEKHNIKRSFNTKEIDGLIAELKKVMQKSTDEYQKCLTEIFEKHGIKFSIVANFRGAPVQGYIAKDNDGVYQMSLTTRGATADIFWFTVFHELGHIVNGDIAKTSQYIDASTAENIARERKADEFAKNALLNPEKYADFVKKSDFSIWSILKFSRSQEVIPCIVIGRLQKEEHIPYNKYSAYKLHYKLNN